MGMMNREKTFDWLYRLRSNIYVYMPKEWIIPMNNALDVAIKALEQEPRCKDCKWWKDSDGEYRRGCGAESQCPINRREVFEGNGNCYLYEPLKGEPYDKRTAQTAD